MFCKRPQDGSNLLAKTVFTLGLWELKTLSKSSNIQTKKVLSLTGFVKFKNVITFKVHSVFSILCYNIQSSTVDTTTKQSFWSLKKKKVTNTKLPCGVFIYLLIHSLTD